MNNDENYNLLVSVIIPYYNASETIKRCINSVIDQTYNNLEILVINDGSKDKIGSSIKDLFINEKRIRYIKHSKNKGVSAARNTGINSASGPLIYFVDADDWLAIDAISKLVKPFLEKKVQLSTAPHYQYINHKKVLKKEYHINQNKLLLKKDTYLYVLDYLKIPYKYIMFVHCWNKIYLKDILIKNQIYFDTNLSQLEDTNFNFKYLKVIDKIYYVHSFTYFHYIEKKSTSASSLSGSEENALEKCVLAFDPIFSFLKYFKIDRSKQTSLRGHHFITISIIFLIRMTRILIKQPNFKKINNIKNWINSKHFQENKNFYKVQKNESYLISFFIKRDSSVALVLSFVARVFFIKLKSIF